MLSNFGLHKALLFASPLRRRVIVLISGVAEIQALKSRIGPAESSWAFEAVVLRGVIGSVSRRRNPRRVVIFVAGVA